ncbi:MAG: hypothetical protein ACKOUT_09225, partial [Novosphingobium sp.]
MIGIQQIFRLTGVFAAATLLGPQQMAAQSSGSVSMPVVQPLPSKPEPEDAIPVNDAAFQGYVQLLAARARAEGVSERTIRVYTEGLTENPRVIALDRSQPGSS